MTVDFLQTCVDAGDDVLERITLAGGAHVAVPIHAAAPDLIHELDEAELLLARGTRLRVTADADAITLHRAPGK